MDGVSWPERPGFQYLAKGVPKRDGVTYWIEEVLQNRKKAKLFFDLATLTTINAGALSLERGLKGS